MKVLADEDQDKLERFLNVNIYLSQDEFTKHGKLREKIRMENKMATVVYTSTSAADKALQNYRSGKVGSYDIAVRPYANKDNYTVFVGGLLPSVDSTAFEKAFEDYQPLLSCSLSPVNNAKQSRNGTITFGSK